MKNISESEAAQIKAEITAMYNIQQTYIIAMYTITTAIIGIAMDKRNTWLYLLPYIVLISFQRVIDAKKYHSSKLSAVLAVYSDSFWERNCMEIEEVLEATYKQSNWKKLRFVRVSSLHLGWLCSILCIGSNILNLAVIDYPSVRFPLDFSILELSPTIVALVLGIIIIKWTKNALDGRATRDKYIDALRKNPIKKVEDVAPLEQNAEQVMK